jgi:hypothetical protein
MLILPASGSPGKGRCGHGQRWSASWVSVLNTRDMINR